MAKVSQDFRVAVVGDAPALVALINSAYRGESSKQGWTTEAELLGGQRTDVHQITSIVEGVDSVMLLHVDHASKEILACVHLKKSNAREAYLGMFTVKPTLQDRGIGRKLLNEAESFVVEHWASTHIKMTVISVRSELISWYERRGYTDTGEREPFPVGEPQFGLPHKPLDFAHYSKALKR